MKSKRIFILLAIFMLVASTLACGLSGGDQAADAPAADQAAENSAPEPAEQQPADAPEVSAPDEAPPAADLGQGDEYRSAEGGYAFKPVPGYEFEEFFGLATMAAPDADPDMGPLLMLIGGLNETDTTSKEIFDTFMEGAESEAVEILEQKEIRVGGQTGLLADIAGDADGQSIVGRIVVVAVTPKQQFTMFATAPRDRWDELASYFDAVIASVHFFTPEEPSFTEELDLDLDDAVSEDTPIFDIPSLEEFPTDASQLPPGGFVYLLASDQGFPTIVAEGDLQDQSTSAEYVLGLVSADQQNAISLFIPLDVAPGILTMKTYDNASPTKGPGAAVYAGSTLYTNTDGIIMIDTMENNTITGSVYFTALDENGNQLAVTGFFNELPLAP